MHLYVVGESARICQVRYIANWLLKDTIDAFRPLFLHSDERFICEYLVLQAEMGLSGHHICARDGSLGRMYNQTGNSLGLPGRPVLPSVMSSSSTRTLFTLC